MRFSSSALISFSLLGFIHLNASPLTLSQAIDILKNQNLEIKSASYGTQSAHNDVKIAEGHHYGSLDFTQNVLRSNDAGNVFGFKLASRKATFADFGLADYMGPGSLYVQPTALNYPGYQNFYQSKLTYSLPLYTGGKISGYENAASDMEAIKQLETTSVTSDKIYKTRKCYYDMALLEHSISHMNTVLANVTTLEKTTQAMMNEGYAKKIDLLEVQAKKANVARMIGEMQANKKLLYHYLGFLLNQNVTEITLPSQDRVKSIISEEDAIASNLDLQKASKALELRQSMLDVAYAPFLPQVGAFAEASSADNTFLGDFNDHRAYTVGAKLTWNLFSGGSDHYALEKARIEQLKTKTEVELAKKGIELQYAQIRTEIESLDLQVESLQKELDFADAIYKNYEGRYREHLSSMNDVLIKQSEQIEKIIALKNVKNQRNERIFALEKLANGAYE